MAAQDKGAEGNPTDLEIMMHLDGELSGSEADLDLERMGHVVSRDDGNVTLRVPRDKLRDVVAHAVSNLELGDLSVKDPPLEETLRQLFGRTTDAGEDE